MKKLVSLFLVLAVILSSCLVVSANQRPYARLEKDIADLPDPSLYTRYDDEGFWDAFQQVEDTVFELIGLKESEMETVLGYEDALLTYIQFVDVYFRTDLPGDMPTAETYETVYTWYQQAMQELAGYEYLDLLCYYTKAIPKPYSSHSTTEGALVWGELQNDISDISIRLDAYVTTLTEEETVALVQQHFRDELAGYPEPTNTDVYWEYVLDFENFRLMVDYSYNPTYSVAMLDEDDYAEYQRLCDAYSDFPDTHRDELFMALDQIIVEQCVTDTLKDDSALKRAILGKPILDEIGRKISHLHMLYGYSDDIQMELGEYYRYEAYRNMVWAPEIAYGDVTGDGAVNAQDALWVLQSAVGTIGLNEDEIDRGDVNGDELVNAGDALYILMYAVEKITIFPVEYIDIYY